MDRKELKSSRIPIVEDDLGYRPTEIGEHVTPENARVVAINPEKQAAIERILWSLRQK